MPPSTTKEEKTMPNERRVQTAQAYRQSSLGSLDRTSYMLLRQCQFPDTYDERDKMLSADHDRLMSWDRPHASRCFQQYTHTGELGLERWIMRASDDRIMTFVKDILKADQRITWTGFRVMGSVHQGNGYPVWTFELFAKHQDSRTRVYTGDHAPNVNREATRDRYGR